MRTGPDDHSEQDESLGGIIYSDIQDQLDSLPALDKPYRDHNGPGDIMEQKVELLQLPEDLASELRRIMYYRDGLHLFRLLGRAGAERDFGLVFLCFRDEIIQEDRPTAGKIFNVIGSEGYDTTMFWTFAPYLFKSLLKTGLSERESMTKVLHWAKDGVSAQNYREYNGHTCSSPHLKGLQEYGGAKWILDEDPNHVSHKFTEQEAERIARILVAEN